MRGERSRKITLCHYEPLQDKGMGVHRATLVLLAFGVGTALGAIGGGAAGQWLYNRRKVVYWCRCSLRAPAHIMSSEGPSDLILYFTF